MGSKRFYQQNMRFNVIVWGFDKNKILVANNHLCHGQTMINMFYGCSSISFHGRPCNWYIKLCENALTPIPQYWYIIQSIF